MVCDEAGELEDELVKNFSVDIRSKALTMILPDFRSGVNTDDIAAVKLYLSELIIKLYEAVSELEGIIAKSKRAKTKMSQTQVGKLLIAKNMHGQIKTVLENWNKCEYVAEDTPTGIMISPLKIDKLSHTLFDNADKVLLMSATIIDHASYAKTLGITDYEYIEVPSTFPAKNAPIIVSSKYKLNRSNLVSLLPTFRDLIKTICENHKAEKGIIHTHSMEITNYMQNNLRGARFLCRERGVDNNDLMIQHRDGPADTVLVSPSLTHGVDLKDDLARFQIIIKAPFLPLNSKRIKKLFKLDPQWYVNRMLATVIQASGRGIRSEDDHCVTYILDGCIIQSILDNAHKLPKYFLNRFI
jgi:Rad3-related DNA helicase